MAALPLGLLRDEPLNRRLKYRATEWRRDSRDESLFCSRERGGGRRRRGRGAEGAAPDPDPTLDFFLQPRDGRTGPPGTPPRWTRTPPLRTSRESRPRGWDGSPSGGEDRETGEGPTREGDRRESLLSFVTPRPPGEFDSSSETLVRDPSGNTASRRLPQNPLLNLRTHWTLTGRAGRSAEYKEHSTPGRRPRHWREDRVDSPVPRSQVPGPGHCKRTNTEGRPIRHTSLWLGSGRQLPRETQARVLGSLSPGLLPSPSFGRYTSVVSLRSRRVSDLSAGDTPACLRTPTW